MSEQSIASGQEFGSRDSDPADPIVANLQQSAKLANENCDRAVALNQTLSAQLREAQDRINQLEREADELGEQLLVEARAIIQDVQSNADATVNRTIREADERIARLKAEAENQIGRLQNELAQATRGTDQVKGEADKRIECVKMETDARVASVETDAKKRIDIIRRENEDKILRLEADLTQAKNRADHAEQWVMLIRREIEEHLMPAMRDGPKPTIRWHAHGHRQYPRDRALWRAYGFDVCGFESPPLHSVVESALTWNQRLLSTEPLSTNRDFPTASALAKRAMPPRRANQAHHCGAPEIRPR